MKSGVHVNLAGGDGDNGVAIIDVCLLPVASAVDSATTLSERRRRHLITERRRHHLLMMTVTARTTAADTLVKYLLTYLPSSSTIPRRCSQDEVVDDEFGQNMCFQVIKVYLQVIKAYLQVIKAYFQLIKTYLQVTKAYF